MYRVYSVSIDRPSILMYISAVLHNMHKRQLMLGHLCQLLVRGGFKCRPRRIIR
jgi:hypothetical protein